ncbi:hypothetical protein Acr_26g0006900 [Actinidia rufa]|uniref:Conserved oligomeric Golgi complex subunit 2 n=1 Tax=Actinidia rufa TaxID=165716 RepID=A0A7J0H2W0_9ERIC|nr:hypothetical protein Acr_26g0006900 [Actinidia rufa]
MADLRSPPPPPSAASPPRSTTDLFGDPIDAHPLWFRQSSFLHPDFDSEAYIADLRTFVPFETLRSELRSHLSSLKHELVELINRDYANFVNLSTKLVDVDAAVVRMRAPLTEIREKIVEFRAAVEGSLVALQSGLRQRAEAEAAKEVLQLLLDTFHVVSKVEKLIKELPSVAADWSNGDVKTAEKDHLSNGISLQYTENGTNLRETQSMLLERIASEMNRLKFYITHAQNLPFIENMEKRIQNASLLLDASLRHCFVDGLEHRDANVIYNCLRAYAAIDNTSSAEEIFRSTVVARLIQKIIPHNSAGVVGGASQDELDEDYKQIKQYIEKDCKFLLEISSTENSGLHVFSFLANSILKEVLSAIQKGKPGAFSPGRPKEFLKNYRASLDILAHLEGYCPSRSAVAKFRAEAVYIEFMKQWNVGVYFSLRYSNWLSAGLAARKAGNTGSNPVSEWAISAVPDDFVYDLRQLKGITATYRMTNKPLPVRHSPYVSGVLRPLKAFLDGERSATYLTRDMRDELVQGAAVEITGRYHELAADLVSVARKTESSLQRIRQGAQRRAGASLDVSDHNVSDTDKICMQLFLDIQEFGRNLAALGVEAAKIPAYRSLWQCVAPTDRQNTISF